MGQRNRITIRDQIDFKKAYGDHPRNKTIPVEDMIGVDYPAYKELRARPNNAGYHIALTSGPSKGVREKKCPKLGFSAAVDWQSIAPGKKIRWGATVNVKTRKKEITGIQLGCETNRRIAPLD